MLTRLLQARTLRDADCIHIVPAKHRGQGQIVPIVKKNVSRLALFAVAPLADRPQPADPGSYRFSYQRDTYICDATTSPPAFLRLPYPASSQPPLGSFLAPPGLHSAELENMLSLYSKRRCAEL